MSCSSWRLRDPVALSHSIRAQEGLSASGALRTRLLGREALSDDLPQHAPECISGEMSGVAQLSERGELPQEILPQIAFLPRALPIRAKLARGQIPYRLGGDSSGRSRRRRRLRPNAHSLQKQRRRTRALAAAEGVLYRQLERRRHREH